MPIVAGVFSSRSRVDRAQGSEEPAVGTAYRHRDIALEAVHLRRRMTAEIRILRDMVDHHELAAVADLITDGGLHLELAVWLEAERDVVLHRAGDPAILGDACNRREAHARRTAHDIEDERHDVDLGDDGHIFSEAVLHECSCGQLGRIDTAIRPRPATVT
jgi:hypothetical protein